MGKSQSLFQKSKNMSKKVEKFVKQICMNLLRKMSIYDIIYSDNKKLSEVIFIGGRKMTPEAKAREVIDRKLEEVGYVLRWCVFSCFYFRIGNNAIHLSFYRYAAACCRCALLPEDAA